MTSIRLFACLLMVAGCCFGGGCASQRENVAEEPAVVVEVKPEPGETATEVVEAKPAVIEGETQVVEMTTEAAKPFVDEKFETALAEINDFAQEHGLDVVTESQIEAARQHRPVLREPLDVASLDLPALGLEPGQTWSRKVRLLSQMLLPMGNNLFNRETEMRLDCRVAQASEDGFTVEVTIAGLKASAKLMYREYSYDHTVDASNPSSQGGKKSHEQEYRDAFAGLVGMKYQARLDRVGNGVKLLELGPRLKAIADNKVGATQGTEQTTMLLARSALLDYAALAMLDAEEGTTIRKGASWRTDSTARVPRAADAVIGRVHKVDSFEDVDGVRTANLGYDISYTPEPSAATKGRGKRGSGLAVVDARGIGEVAYDVAAGRIASQVEKMRVEIKSGFAGQSTGDSEGRRQNKIYYLINRFVETMREE